MNRILKFAVFTLAIVYFVVDAVSDRCQADSRLDRRASPFWWNARMDRIAPAYPALALFAVPLIVLEPIKPAAAYLAGTGHISAGLTLLVVGEILKLVLVERLFTVSRSKLMSIPAFALGLRRISADHGRAGIDGSMAGCAALVRDREGHSPKLRGAIEGLSKAGSHFCAAAVKRHSQ